MSFVPDTDVNYQKYLTAIGQPTAAWQAAEGTTYPISSIFIEEFRKSLIKYLAKLTDASTHLVTGTTMTAALLVAKTLALSGNYLSSQWSTFTPDGSTNYQTYLTARNQGIAADGSSYTEVTPMSSSRTRQFDEAIIQWFCLQMTGGVTLNPSTSMPAAVAAALASTGAQGGANRDF